MKNQKSIKRNVLGFVCATALAVVSLLSVLQPVRADDLTPPAVPANIQVPAGNKLFLVGHAVGTQNYNRLAAPSTSSSMSMRFLRSNHHGGSTLAGRRRFERHVCRRHLADGL